jgi:hypothetical protein
MRPASLANRSSIGWDWESSPHSSAGFPFLVYQVREKWAEAGNLNPEQ